MSAYEQSSTCAWCLVAITRAGYSRAPWRSETGTSCVHRDDGKYHHEPLEPGASPKTVCRCTASETALGTMDPTNCTLHHTPWTP